MLTNLTQVADYRGLRIVRSAYLAGFKYGVKFQESGEVFVSPAVYDLLKTDFEAVAQSLKVRELPGRPRAPWRGA